jgi:AcrR family transcriptional regulator
MAINTEVRILQAVSELFYRHGVKSITMDDISKHLGMSKKTIYESYENKDEIVKLLAKREIDVQFNDMLEIRKRSENAVDEIFGVMRYMAAKFSLINPTMFYDLQKYHSEAWAHFREFKESKMQVFIEENLKLGIKQELYRAEMNAKIMARLRMEEVELAFNPAAFPPDKFKVVDVHIELLNHFVHGIATLKGHKLINKYSKQR